MKEWYGTTKNFIETTYYEVQEALSKYSIDDEDLEVIMDNYQELAHQYSLVNSHFVVFEKLVREELGEDKFQELTKKHIHNPELKKHIQENYPDFGIEEE